MMPAQACLETINPHGQVAFQALDAGRGVTTIGRQAENDVVIHHPEVAPFQAVLDHRQKPCQIIVLSDEGETRLGGHLLPPGTSTALRHGDALQIAGHTIVLFEEEVAAKAEPVPAPASPPAPLATAVAAPGSASMAARERAVGAEQRPHYEFGVGELTPRRQSLSWFTPSGQVSIPITNRGNREALFRLEGADQAGTCRFEFQAPGETVSLARQVEFRVQPGETVVVPVRITPLSRRLVGLGKQAHFCTLTTTLLAEWPTRRAVLAQLQSAPLIGPGLAALITICLVALIGFIFPFDRLRALPQTVSYAGSDGKVARGHEAYSEAASIAFAENNAAHAGQMTYEEMFREIAQEYDLDWRLLVEQAYRESRLDPLAIGGANEAGLMQILPSTWSEWAPKVGASDPWDPYSNVLVAAAYLAFLREYCSDMGYPGEDWMLAAYNWGPHNLDQLFADGGGWAQVPAKTRRYVLDVLQPTGASAASRLAGLGPCRRLSVASQQVTVRQSASLPTD